MRLKVLGLLFALLACNTEEPGSPVDVGPSTDAQSADARQDAAPQDSGFQPDAEATLDAGFDLDAQPSDSGELVDAEPDSGPPPDAELDSGESVDSAEPTDADPGPDAAADASVDAGFACDSNPCFPGVSCEVLSSGAFDCGDCPIGYAGDGVTCSDFDACTLNPCLAGTTCTDRVAPDPGYSCSPCVGATCPILRALAGPDQETLAGRVVSLEGSASGNNGAITCSWSNDQDPSLLTTCSATVTVQAETSFELTVTDASGASASDELVVSIVPLVADAGRDQNKRLGDQVTLTASWSGASCSDGSCIECVWRNPDRSILATTCTTTTSPTFTTQYELTITDTLQGVVATDATTIFVTDAPANLCGWNVVVMTSVQYPTAPNPNYTCTPDGRARRQTVNGKPSLVVSDLEIENAKIVGYIGVETSSDDDLIGILWGMQNPAHTYLLSWKQISQDLGACGNALAGVAVKKIDGAAGAPTTISYNSAFGFNATDYVYTCADGWATDRLDESLLSPGSFFFVSPRDPGASAAGWRDFITYRFEIYHVADRSKVFIYEDDTRSGSTAVLTRELEIADSSYPRGQVAFFSNSQAQVDFGDFTFASLADFGARAGDDFAVDGGQTATLTGAAELAVPPYSCSWSESGLEFSGTCTTTTTPSVDTTYTLRVTDGFGRVAEDDVRVTVAP
ncbi:MAG: hypothetical protein HY791_13800 [Deltaproteobacteria bacterium]|nr:hypothetical protein [Deltaproteobacteria bacterium]